MKRTHARTAIRPPMTGMQREGSEAPIPQISATTWCAISVRDGINWTQVHLNAANQTLDAVTMGGLWGPNIRPVGA
jgi:hypothetical protein